MRRTVRLRRIFRAPALPKVKIRPRQSWHTSLTGFNPSDRGSMGSFTLYLVDGTEGVLIETDTAQLVLGRVERAP